VIEEFKDLHLATGGQRISGNDYWSERNFKMEGDEVGGKSLRD